jgi:hypothetical protein
MRTPSHPSGLLKRRRAARRCRALDRAALRAEFELDPPYGLRARLRACARSVKSLEPTRLHAHLWAGRPRAAAAPASAPVPASDVAPKRTASH